MGCSSTLLARFRGTRYLSLHLGILYSSQQLICFLLLHHLWPNLLYRAACLQISNGFFCSVNHLSGGGVNANHNATHSPSLARKKQDWEWPQKWSRTAKKSRWWVEFLLRAGGRHCFLARDKNKKDHKKLQRELVNHCLKQCETGRSQSANLETQKQTKLIETHQSQVNMCFLRGLLRWLMEQKNPKLLWSLKNTQPDTMNLAITTST